MAGYVSMDIPAPPPRTCYPA